MPVTFRDRISGQITGEPSEYGLPGQYCLAPGASADINRAPAVAGDFLVPAATGTWLVEDRLTSARVAGGHVPQRVWLPTGDPGAESSTEVQALLEIGVALHPLYAAPEPLPKWLNVAPIVQSLDYFIRPNKTDDAIRSWLRHLQEVCAHPHSYLRTDEEPVLIDRVKRVASRAVEYLASHPEDWASRQYRSVMPERILALTPEDEFNLYENRLAARLVKRLDRYLRGRLLYLKQFREGLESVAIEHGSHWRYMRIGEVVAKAINNPGDTAAQVRTLIQDLEGWHYQVRQLYDSQLYQRVPREARVPETLVATNILVNDRHYRYVGLLWRRLARRTRTEQEEYADSQRLCRDFNAYCALLAVWALKQLKYKPEGEPLQPGGEPVTWTGIAGAVTLKWQGDGTLSLERIGSKDELRLVPLPAALTADVRPEFVQAQLEAVRQTLRGAEPTDGHTVRVITLYPGSSQERILLRLPLQIEVQSVGHETPTKSPAGFLPVSLLEADSVERVARALRWWLWKPHLEKYPLHLGNHPSTEVKSLVDQGVKAHYLAVDAKSRAVTLHRPISAIELGQVDDTIESRFQELKKKIGGDGYAPHQVAPMRRFREALDKENAIGWKLLTCPVCPNLEVAHFEARENNCYECRCENCDSTWGLYRCSECATVYPALMPGGVGQMKRQETAGWLDATLGCDVLAIPCWLGEVGAYICPNCGVCGKARQADAHGGCARCRAIEQVS